jgi:outer membrane protein OmpA-like peptidoglycan-associated protein
MAINLLEMLQNQVGGELAGQASKFLGESESNTTKAVGAILPTLLGSLVGKGSSESGARGILDFLKSNNIDGGILSNLAGLFGGGQSTDNLMNSGSGILKYLVGDKLGSIVDVISNVAGVKTGSSSSLLKMASPLLMGFVGKFIKDKALDALGLKNLLGGQKDFISKSVPSALSSVLGLANLGSSSTSTPSAKSGGSSTSGGGNDMLKWLLPLLLIGALALWFGRKGCNKEVSAPAVTETIDKAKAMADSAAMAAKKIADSIAATISKLSLPGGISLNTKKGSFTDKIATYLTSDTLHKIDPKMSNFTFDGVNFKTGSDSLTAESNVQLDELVSVLKAFAKVSVKVTGYTDNQGDAMKNKKLSEARAKSVKAYVVGKGVEGKRIETAGLGAANPVGDNNTEAGRAANRRVEVSVTKK